ncbi:hypothetical protein CD351_07460 [Erythrobacter sp. KY5]|uniref:DMP19 family protein n=1 Tax=Erythrobacter sp. KY5 TaxID=2011159 RepID=UPI000DBF0CFA|nr:DUF4375 domain-containing protein [Erythrobacter sp. KY5]AWW74264.1 hypothetical protein CD351_07460 [Erythrobacter sp. KY5]
MGIFNAPREYPKVFEPYWDDFNFYDGRAAWLKSIEKIPDKAVNLFAVHCLHAEVHNGGFGQYFFNSTGTSAPEAVRGFGAIGMSEVASLIEDAMAVLGSPYPCDTTDARRDRLETLDEDFDFGDFDDRFYELADTEQFFRKLPKFVPFADRYAAQG